MNLLALTSLSFGMSMDAFAAALAKGAADKNSNWILALKGGVFFGVVEAIAPMLGFLLAKVASDQVASFDHWIAFVLLMVLGMRFMTQAIWGGQSSTQVIASNQAMLLMTAIATSIDSMVVGVSLAFLEVNIYLACALIGLTTTLMATIGLYLGNRLGRYFGKVAMAFGGVVLMVIGSGILYSHLTA